MGGNVGIIIKKANGEQVAMDRWTNIMPHFFRDADLYLNNFDQWYEKFSEQWLLMKKDYEENKETGNFQKNMTSVYFPHDNASPSEYGIITVDVLNKKIMSSQGYCLLGQIAIGMMKNVDDSENNNLETLFKSNFIKKIVYDEYELDKVTDSYNVRKTDLNVSELTWESFSQLVNEIKESKFFTHPLLSEYTPNAFDKWNAHIIIESGWTIVHYKETKMGLLELKEQLEKDGFTFTSEDNNAWKEYFKAKWQRHDDDDLNNNKEYQDFKVKYKEIFKEDCNFSNPKIKLK